VHPARGFRLFQLLFNYYGAIGKAVQLVRAAGKSLWRCILRAFSPCVHPAGGFRRFNYYGSDFSISMGLLEGRFNLLGRLVNCYGGGSCARAARACTLRCLWRLRVQTGRYTERHAGRARARERERDRERERESVRESGSGGVCERARERERMCVCV